MGDEAIDLRGADRLRQKGERLGLGVAALALQLGPIDGSAIESRRRSGLEAPEAEAELLQPFAQPDRRVFAHAPGRKGLRADMDHAAQKGPGGQDQRAAGDLLTRGGRDPFDAAIFQENIGGLGFDHAEMFECP